MLRFVSFVQDENFFPLIHTHKREELISGIWSFKERISRKIENDNLFYFFNDALIDIDISNFEIDKAYFKDGHFLFAVTKKEKDFLKLDREEFSGYFILANYIGDYMLNIGAMIKKDFAMFFEEEKENIASSYDDFSLIGSNTSLFIHYRADILDGVIFDTTNGPIIVDEYAKIAPFTYIEGPTYIGKGAKIDGAKIRGNCYIGRVCKIAGEIEDSVFLPFSNKHHDGFIGHSYIGSWVNLGALTTNSDLKNNYGIVKIHKNASDLFDTKNIKIGAFIGDHVKTGIGTLLNTGTVIGTGALLYGGGMFPKYIPPFSWVSPYKFAEYDIDKFIKTEKTVMLRRDIKMNEEYESNLRKLHKITEKEREKGIKLWEN